MQNQDPLDPLDANEFTSQLVQFASVEQQIQQNANLEQMVALQQTSQVATMVDYLGTTIEAFGDTVYLGEEGSARFAFVLTESAVDTDIIIQNSSGETVATMTGATDIGKHEIVWDGTNNQGNRVEAGEYTVIVTPKDYEGLPIEVVQTIQGEVTGAGSDEGNVTMFLNTVLVPMENIISVRETTKATEEAVTDTTNDTSGDEEETDSGS